MKTGTGTGQTTGDELELEETNGRTLAAAEQPRPRGRRRACWALVGQGLGRWAGVEPERNAACGFVRGQERAIAWKSRQAFVEYRGCLYCMTARVRLNRRRSPAALDDGEVAATARWNLPLPAAAKVCAAKRRRHPERGDAKVTRKNSSECTTDPPQPRGLPAAGRRIGGDAKVTPKNSSECTPMHSSRGVAESFTLDDVRSCWLGCCRGGQPHPGACMTAAACCLFKRSRPSVSSTEHRQPTLSYSSLHRQACP